MKTEYKWLVVSLSVLLVFQSIYASMGPRNDMRKSRLNYNHHMIRMTPEDENKTLEYLKSFDQDLYEELLSIKDSRPEFFRRTLSRIYREMHYLKRLKEEDPDRYENVLEEKKLEKTTKDLAKKYRKSEDRSEKEKIKAELNELLYKLFEYRQMNRQYEINRLEERLQLLKEDMEERVNNKEEIIENRLDKLIGDNDSLKW